MTSSPVDSGSFFSLVDKHFAFLNSDYGFRSGTEVATHADQFKTYHKPPLTITISQKRFSFVCVFFSLDSRRTGVDMRRMFRAIGVVSDEALEEEYAINAVQVDEVLNRLSDRLKRHGQHILELETSVIELLSNT